MRAACTIFALALGCSGSGRALQRGDERCTLVERGFGPDGEVAVRAEEVVSGLEVPWGIAFLEGGDLLVTERPGRLRLVHDGALVERPLADASALAVGEGGLLGVAAHPDFAQNRLFYLYLTARERGGRRTESSSGGSSDAATICAPSACA